VVVTARRVEEAAQDGDSDVGSQRRRGRRLPEEIIPSRKATKQYLGEESDDEA
jgi:hypothetical protein